MAQGQQLFILSISVLIFLIVLSKCNSYPLFNELPVPSYPTKFHSQKDVDRYVNRMKQYYDTIAQLRYWRRDIDESNDDSDEILQNTLRHYKNLEYKI